MQARPAGDKVLILVPFKQHTNRNTTEELNILLQKGFSAGCILTSETVRIEDLLHRRETAGKTKKQEPKLLKNSSSFLLIDRLVVKDFDEDDQHRIADSSELLFMKAKDEMLLEINGEQKLTFSNRFEMDGIQFEEPVPNLFSFNNPYGACPTCEGFSQVLGIDADLVIPDKRLSVYEGAVAPWKGEKLSAVEGSVYQELPRNLIFRFINPSSI